jgi:predicted nucleic acid-binding protein
MPDSIVDSCCLINLFAADDLLTILPPLRRRLYVPKQVLDESLYVRQTDPADASRLMQRTVDLMPAMGAGLLSRCELDGDEELDLFVRLATTLDDGEAACLAIAKSRSWALATDDRKGRREAGGLGVPVITTPELMKIWADATKADEPAIARLLRNIRDHARFTPHHTMPLHGWWLESIRKGGG